jgi:protocatechuate 3,4-dioxygenase beta subunit
VDRPRLSRRRFIEASALALPAVLVACGEDEDQTSAPAARRLAPTPACDDDDDPTPEQTEGPYFKPDSPRRRSLLEPGVTGTQLVLAGRVLSEECRPVRRALLDFWQADGEGNYDNERFRLRGHQFSDARGRFQLRTVVPGLYTGRTRHIHVKVQAPRGRVLTTQLYLPGEPRNRGDGIFDPALLMAVRGARPRRARFDFVLAA